MSDATITSSPDQQDGQLTPSAMIIDELRQECDKLVETIENHNTPPGANSGDKIGDSTAPAGKPDEQLITKRRRNVMTLQQKLDIIARLKNGEKMTKLAIEYGVGKATLSDIKRQEEKITAFVTKMETNSSSVHTPEKRRTMHKPRDELVERALQLWLNREREKGQIHITGPILKEKARDFHRQLYGKDCAEKFTASTGWLDRFKQRNGLLHKSQPKRAKSTLPKPAPVVDGGSQLVQSRLAHLRALVHGLCLGPDQIYSMTRTRLHWRALPGVKDSDCAWSPLAAAANRDCFDIISCSNATGSHRLRLALVGQHETPWRTASTNTSKMPFCYYAHEEGRLSRDIFLDWFHNEFVVGVCAFSARSGISAAALLLVEEAPFNSGEDELSSLDGHVQCATIPSAAAFLTQPVSNFLFENIRQNYRKKLIARIVTLPTPKKFPPRLLDLSKTIAVKDAGYMLSEVWSEVPGDTILQLWRDALYCLGVVFEQAAVVNELLRMEGGGESGAGGSVMEDTCSIFGMLREKYRGVTEMEVAQWLTLDSEDPNCSAADKEILEHVLASTSEESENHSRVEVEPKSRNARSLMKTNGSGAATFSVGIPSDGEAYTCLSKCLAWLEVQPDCEPAHLQLLWKLQNKAAQKRT